MQGQAYGTRMLGATGDSSMLGGKLNWNNVNKDASAALEITKQIHGHTNVSCRGWNKNEIRYMNMERKSKSNLLAI